MSIIIRLQNLPWTANAEDIRQFFRELVIPEGGVHIVGGEHGDAFIVFGSDEDARQAMMKDGGQIKDIKVKLLLSSRVEMQKVIDAARQQALTSQNLIQTLASATRLEPSNMQVPLLPNMLTTLPALLNLAGMGALPALTTMPSAQTLPTMPTIPNVAGIPSLPPSLATAVAPVKTPAPKMEEAKGSTQTTHSDKNRDEKDVNRRNRSKSRSRSRDRGANRDRHRYDDRSQDYKYGRDQNRGADRDNDLSKGRRRSRSRDRRNSDHNRDRDYHRSRDKKRDVSPLKDDINGKETLDRDSRYKSAPEMTDIGKNNPTPFHVNRKSDWVQKTSDDNNDGRMMKPAAENIANRFPGMMPSTMISPWILPLPSDKLAGAESRKPILPSNSELPRSPFGMFPIGPAFSHAANPMYPFTAFPAVPRPEVPREVTRNVSLPTSQSAEGFRKDSEESSRVAERRKPDSDQLEDEVDCFGRHRRKVRRHSFSPERNNGEFHDRRDRHRFRDEGFGHSNYNEEDRGYRNNHDDMNRRGGYRRDFDRRDRPDNRRPNFRDRFDNAPNEASFTNGNCVEMRNIPKDAKEIDIKKFFSPLPLYDSSIKFQFDHRGSRTRLAFIKFANSEHKMEALKYNGEVINDYRVHVVHLEDAEWETAENTVNIEVREPFLKVSFIPKRARTEDIREAFIDPPEEVVLSRTEDRESYTAFLRFNEKFSVIKALKNKHRILICDSRVKLEPSYEEDFLLAKNEEEDRLNGGKSREDNPESNKRPVSQQSGFDENSGDHRQSPTEEGGNRATPSRYVLLTNLPSDVTDKDILNFFADVKAFPTRIHVMFNDEGHQTGEVYCEFSNDTGVQNALQKNKCLYDDRSIYVSTVSEEDAMKAVRPHRFPRFGQRSRPPYSGYRGRAPFGRPPLSRSHGRGPFSRETPGVEDFGRPGCVLSMENVPYKADVEDIIDFFDGYDICRDDVIRRFNDFGLATGDARVCLRSPEDALRAYRELNRMKIQDRTIFLHLVP